MLVYSQSVGKKFSKFCKMLSRQNLDFPCVANNTFGVEMRKKGFGEGNKGKMIFVFELFHRCLDFPEKKKKETLIENPDF